MLFQKSRCLFKDARRSREKSCCMSTPGAAACCAVRLCCGMHCGLRRACSVGATSCVVTLCALCAMQEVAVRCRHGRGGGQRSWAPASHPRDGPWLPHHSVPRLCCVCLQAPPGDPVRRASVSVYLSPRLSPGPTSDTNCGLCQLSLTIIAPAGLA
jgi:hypothetical protein